MFLNYISVLIVSAFDAWHYLFVVLGLEIKPDFYLTIINNRIYYTLLSRFFLHKNKKKQMELRMKGKSVQCAIVLLAVGILIFGTGFFEPAREKGLAIACTNNLKQIVLGIILFADDNSDKLPAAQDWEKKISSYVGGEKAFVCPKTNYKQHYLYFGNGQEKEKVDNQDTVIILVCESDHMGKMNVAFLDGHCASMDAKAVNAAIEAAKAAGNDTLPILK